MSHFDGNQVWSFPNFREKISKIEDDSTLQLQSGYYWVCSDSPNSISKAPNRRQPTPEKGLRRFLRNIDFEQNYNN